MLWGRHENENAELDWLQCKFIEKISLKEKNEEGPRNAICQIMMVLGSNHKALWHLITPFSSRLLLLGTIMIVQHFFITCIEIICVSWLQIREKWEMSAGRSKVWGIHGIDRNVYNVCWWGIGFLIPLFLCVCPSVPLMDVVVAGKESTIEASKAMHLTPLLNWNVYHSAP